MERGRVSAHSRNSQLLKRGAGLACLGLAALILLAACAPARTRSTPSPDGTLTLVTSVNMDDSDPATYLCVRFQILTGDGRVVFEQQTAASDRMHWSMTWDGNSRVVLESADVGTYAWEQVEGVWGKAP